MTDAERAIRDGRNLMLALEMHDFGVAMMRQNLSRMYPAERPDEIEQRLIAWLHSKPLPIAEPDICVAEGRSFR